MEEMASLYLADFELERSRLHYFYGREYVYSRSEDGGALFIHIGLYPSADRAEKAANTYFSLCSAFFYEWSYPDFVVGDKCWSTSMNNETENLRNIVFLRKNVLLILSSSDDHTDVGRLAETIDGDIITNASYVDLDVEILLPSIDSIRATKTVLIDGESSIVTVYASDPHNKSLEYEVIGMTNRESDPENVFIERATRDFIGEPFYGTHKYEFIVMNESNVYSEIAEFELTIIE
jgi:hypothetical protein